MQTANRVPAYGSRRPSDPLQDEIRADPTALPYVGPLDLDNYGAETDEMRAMYLRYHRTEPAARAAVEGLVASIADMDVAVLPEDEDEPDDRRVAEFVDWTVEDTPHGWDGLIRKVVLPALLLGYSVTETVLRGTDHRKWGGFWGVRHCKSKDTNHLRLQVDAVNRDVVGVVNTVRGMASYAPDKVIVFTHADLFDNPHGVGELRAAYRACQLIDNAYKLWHYALNVYGGPFLKATTNDKAVRPQLARALAEARQGGFIVCDEKSNVEILNMAAAANFDAFERKIDKLREEIWLTVRGAYLPFMQSSGGGGETRGSADTAKTSGSDPKERLIAKAVGRCLTRQLSARLARVNFGPHAGVPKVILGGVNWGETAAQLDVAERMATKFRRPISAKWLYKVSQMPPPVDAEDAAGVPPLPPPANPLALPGLGGGPTAETFRR